MRLIDADALKNDLDVQYFVNNERVFDIPQIKAFVDIEPTVEAKSVVYGEWNEYEEEYNAWQCSECGKVWLLAYGTPKENDMNYCTKCGSDMRGGKNE